MIYLNKQTTEAEINLRVIAPLKAMLSASRNGVDFEMKEHRQTRSTAQNRFYWENVGQVVNVLNEAGCTYGEDCLPFTSEIIHEINKIKLGVQTTTRLSVKEFCEFMDKMFAFWIERTAGVFVPLETASSYLERTGLLKG